MTLQISLLGSPQLSRDGESLVLPGYRPLALLAYLLLSGKAQSREHLIGLLFDRPDDPRAALRWTLSKLRKVLGADSILADRQQISFNFASDYWLDVHAFEGGDLDLYSGDFLDGLHVRDARQYEAWLLVQREKLRSRYQSGLELRLVEQQSVGEAKLVEETAIKLLRLDNMREDWHRVLMRAFAKQGKFEAALAQYNLCQNILHEELDLDPAPETVTLAQEIKNEQTALYSVLAARASTTLAQSDLTAKSAGREETRGPETIVTQSHLAGLDPRWSLKRLALIAVVGLGIFLLVMAYRNIGGPESTSDVVEASDLASRDLAGTTVTMGGYYLHEMDINEASVANFEEETGINIEFIDYGAEFEAILDNIILSGLTPDIIKFPQPGYLADFVRIDKVVDVQSFMDDDYLQEQYSAALLEAAMIDGQMAGIWHLGNVKSLVWYPKRAFEEAGYEVPQTWEELMALSERIVTDGGTPWCIGIESGEATGWVGTDWVEDILLRTAPPETYDAWVSGELPFDSPEIRRAFEIMGDIWLVDSYIYGGTAAIPSERFYVGAQHMFEQPPGCFLHRQGSFILSDFPEEAQFGLDYDFFYLPPINKEFGNPVLGGGDILAMFNDRPEVREVMKFYTTGESVRYQVESGKYIAPHRDVPFEWYSSPANLKIAQILLEADTYRFDASDLMPGAVGTGTFWRGITAWVEGEDLESVLRGIDESWPETE